MEISICLSTRITQYSRTAEIKEDHVLSTESSQFSMFTVHDRKYTSLILIRLLKRITKHIFNLPVISCNLVCRLSSMAVSSDVRMRKPCLQMLLFSRGFKHMAAIERYVALNLENFHPYHITLLHSQTVGYIHKLQPSSFS